MSTPSVPVPSSATGPGDGQVRLVATDRLRPSPENELIYRRIQAGDRAMQDLIRSIKRHGILDPLVITRDHYILSGHRRHFACRLLGIKEVPARVVDVGRHDPEFEELLVEHNRYRVKGIDEIIREQVVTRSPAEAYQALIAHRQAQSEVSGEFLVLGRAKRRKQISHLKMPMLLAAGDIVMAHRKHWPLSDRTVHYRVLNDPPLRNTSNPESRCQNNRNCYKDLTDILTRGRLEGLIPFAAIEDPTRKTVTWSMDKEPGTFIRRNLDEFLDGYSRDLQQSQPHHIEIIGEKNTIENCIRDVAMRYCIPYTLGRGYCSLDPRYKMTKRFKASGKSKLITPLSCIERVLNPNL
jgi:hypothetical protein